MKFKHLLLMLLLSTSLYSQDMITDRPDMTESPNTVKPGTVQIETGAMLEMYTINIDKIDMNAKVMSLPSTLFRVGVFSFMELRLGTSYITNSFDAIPEKIEMSHFSAYDVSVKLNILDGGFGLGFLAGCELNNANLGGETSSPNPYAIIAASHDVTDGWSMGYNLGIFVDGLDPDGAEVEYAFASVASGFEINDKVGAFVELYSEINSIEEVVLYYDNGLTYKLSETVQLDVSFGTCITERYNFYSCGVSWLIK